MRIEHLGRWATAVVCLIFSTTAYADWTLPGPGTEPGTLFLRNGYDYGPSMYEEEISGVRWQYFWWCGFGEWTPVGRPSRRGDVIWYRAWNDQTGWVADPQMVLTPSELDWDSELLCDPEVVRGSFTHLGVSYSHAMYYTATDDTALGGVNNRIGVAFSNDGVIWPVRVGPIISPMLPIDLDNPSQRYGAGQSSAHNIDGQSHIRMFFTDSTAGGARFADSTDGKTFFFSTPVSNKAAPVGWNDAFAYDSSTGRYYAAVPNQFRPEGETYLIGIYRIDGSALSSGAWEFMGAIDSSLTGFWQNFAPGFLRNRWGDHACPVSRGLKS